MDRMAEEGFHLGRFNNGSAAKKPDIYVNLERRMVVVLSGN